ncbi:PAS domain-containing protein [Horticoccus luteus]|uniref:histidine kinase n=1 Tax=Horticoccus luteus TaxID=2862869 RepID=A0A8F9XKF9_9BACT|nr:ATP-binding protein [Horticoccus luteus]QYM78161.1 PAS domain-containing protein [Horticoccus luteus]
MTADDTNSPPRPADASAPALFALDAAGRITWASRSAAALGATAAPLIGEPFVALFVFDVVSRDPDLLEAQWDAVRAATATGPLRLSLRSAAAPDDDPGLAVDVQLEPGPNGDDWLATILPAPAADAARPAATDTESEAFRWLVEQGGVGFFDLNFATGRIYYSPAWKKLLGYVASELPDTYESWLGHLHPDDTGAAPDRLTRKPTAGPHAFSVEFRLRHRRGEYVWVQCTGLQQIDAAGAVTRAIGLCSDITERKELEEASVANDERFRTLAEDEGPLGAFEFDFTGAGTGWVSSSFAALTGFDDPAPLASSANFLQVLPPEAAELGLATWLLARGRAGQPHFAEPIRVRRRDGSALPVLFGAVRQVNRRRELLRVTGFICPLPADCALATEATATTALPAELAREAFGALAEGVLLTDAKGRIVFLNATASRLLRLSAEQVRDHPASDVFRLVDRESGRPGDDACEAALSAEAPLNLRADQALAAVAPDEAPVPIVWTARAVASATGQTLGVVIVFRDPDEMSLTPEELIKANRFEALGLLAGGIAHDFNNLLTTILGGVSLAKDSRDLSKLEDSEKASLAAKALTRQLLTVAKGGLGAESVVPSAEILHDAVRIAASGSDAVVTVEVPEGTDPVLMDRSQMLQVFQNLVVNAIQAMPPPPHRGRVQLSAVNVTLADDQIAGLPAGDYVQFESRDNAAGIKPEHLEKIFDPFFTTKKHGTGLGLATVLSIVRKHGGQIGVDSTVGVGTVFTIFLPKADRPAEVQARRAPSLRFGTGRVLFMDDDPKISALTAGMLQSLDYKFDLAKNGEEAVTLYKRYLNIGRPYDLVIMDVTVIGGMGAAETFTILRELDPDVRAIVASGYDNDDIARQFMDQGFSGYLAKPYRVTDLGKVMKTVLG